MSMNDRQQAHGQPDDEMEPEGQRQPAAGDGNPEKFQMPAGDAPQQVGQPMQWTAGETPQPLPYSRPVNPPQSVNRPQPVGHSQPPVAGQWAPASEPRPMPPIPSGTRSAGDAPADPVVSAISVTAVPAIPSVSSIFLGATTRRAAHPCRPARPDRPGQGPPPLAARHRHPPRGPDIRLPGRVHGRERTGLVRHRHHTGPERSRGARNADGRVAQRRPRAADRA